MMKHSRRQHLAMWVGAGIAASPRSALAGASAEIPYKSPQMKGFTEASLNEVRKAAGIPAMAAAYASEGGEPFIIADGLRSIDGAERVTTRDLWHIGSMTKSMTSTLVARLVERGAGVTWDTTIAEILGSSMPKIQESYKRATFRHLCSHHAGFGQDPIDLAAPHGAFPELSKANPHPDRMRFAALALEAPPIAAPGEKLSYSNSGYEVAATMLEVAFNNPWEALIDAEVFAPLVMGSAGFGPPGTPGVLDQPLGHQLAETGVRLVPAILGDPDKPADLPAVIRPAGLVHTSPADLLLYLDAHLHKPESFLRARTAGGFSIRRPTQARRTNMPMQWVGLSGPTGRSGTTAQMDAGTQKCRSILRAVEWRFHFQIKATAAGPELP